MQNISEEVYSRRISCGIYELVVARHRGSDHCEAGVFGFERQVGTVPAPSLDTSDGWLTKTLSAKFLIR
jgi:hypothetical protein